MIRLGPGPPASFCRRASADRFDAAADAARLVPGLAGVTIMALAPDWRWAAPGFLVRLLGSGYLRTNVHHAVGVTIHPPRRMPLQAVLTLMWAVYSLGLRHRRLDRRAFSLRTVYLISTFWFVPSTLAIMRTRPYPTPEPPPGGHDYRGLLRRRAVTGPLVVFTLGFVAILTGQTLSSQYLEEARGFSLGAIGMFGSLSALGTAVFSLLLGQPDPWRGFFSSLLLVLVSFALLVSTGHTLVVAAAAFLLGAHYAARPLAASVIGARVPAHQHGVAYALVDTMAGLATLIGTNAAGRLFAANPNWPFAVGMVGLALVTALGVALRLRGTTRALRLRILRVQR